MYNDATAEEINEVMQKAWEAFHAYRKFSLKQRAKFGWRFTLIAVSAKKRSLLTNTHFSTSDVPRRDE